MIDTAYPPPNELGQAMKSIVPSEGAARLKDVVKGVCSAGPCAKCAAMILCTGRVCHGIYDGQTIDIPPVFGKSRSNGKSSLLCVSFCNTHSEVDHELKQQAALRRKQRRMPQTRPGNRRMTLM